MSHACRLCSRVNPPEALFCYHDGAALDGHGSGAPLAAGSQPFPAPFVFPSGRTCRNFDELLLACEDEWDAAREMLVKGFLAGFLGGLGRADLARAAERAAQQRDRDRAFDDLLASMPGSSRAPASLVVRPSEVTLGELRPGVDRRLVFHLENQGGGLLYGSAAAKDDWLRIGDGPGLAQKAVQFRGQMDLTIQVVGRALRAGDKPLSGRLVIRTNGGERTVTVRASVPPLPFGDGVLSGARTPRELAHKARDHAKDAARSFESGAVRRWYEANGWSYPVLGPGATGPAAVQQFFEALGLVEPPPVRLVTESVHLEGRPGEELEAIVTVQALERSPVYVHGTATEDWVQVGTAELHGQTARLPVRVPGTPNRVGETLRALVWLTANGGQRLTVDVELIVTDTPRPLAGEAPPVGPRLPEALPVPEPAIPEPAAPPPKRKRRRLRPRAILSVALLLLLLMPCLRDCVWLVYLAKVRGVGVGPPNPDAPRIELAFHDTERQRTLPESGKRPAAWPPSMRFGVALIADEQGRKFYTRKRLTFDEHGLTNNTVVRLNGAELLFGEAGPSPGRGHWRTLNESLDRRSVWVYDREHLSVTQTVEIVRGSQSNALDTVLVRYTIANEGEGLHRVGVRFMLDTFVGTTDGVPVLVPGQEQLCTTSVALSNPRTIPDFLQMRERDDLRNPGMVAQVTMRVPGLEAPNRVTVGAWPSAAFGDDVCLEGQTRWEVPVYSMHKAKPPDSAVVLYWNERELLPGQSRELGFTYGLGHVHGGEGRGKLAVTAGGSFEHRGEFTVTAYVARPVPGQTVALSLPNQSEWNSFELISGPARQAVPQPGAGLSVSPVTWRVRATPMADKYSLRVESSDGTAQGLPVVIGGGTRFGNN
jgi:hypothetical protein